jgi:hypothetical protein
MAGLDIEGILNTGEKKMIKLENLVKGERT